MVRIGHTTIDSVTRAMQSLCNNNVLGIVVNGARRGELYSKYTYYHSYYTPKEARRGRRKATEQARTNGRGCPWVPSPQALPHPRNRRRKLRRSRPGHAKMPVRPQELAQQTPEEPSGPRVSAVLVPFNQAPALRRAIEALERSRIASGWKS